MCYCTTMAEGLSSTHANELLDALLRSDAYDGPAAVYVKLHTGAPGAAGTSNAAGNTTRQAVTFGASSGGAISNDAAVTWTSVSTSEDYTHFSIWDASVAGNFMISGTITANAVVSGDTFTIAIGDLDITLTVAS